MLYMLKHLVHRRATVNRPLTNSVSHCFKFNHAPRDCQSMRHAMFHLVPLQLKEVVEIVGVEGRAQVRRCGSLAEIEIRVGRVGFGSERVKGAGLVGVL